MAMKRETAFRRRVREKLDKIPNAYFESIQQVGINGSPDLMGFIGPLGVAIELKTDDGISSPLQTYKRDRIAKLGAIAMVIAPHNFEASVKFLENLSKQCLDFDNDKPTKGSTDDKVNV